MKPVSIRNLHSHVVQELGRRIVGGELKPGELLPREETLAEQMTISRTALRESLKVLTSKGLIETKQKTGTRVRETRYWNQLDADVLAWRCESMPTQDFVHKLAEMREIIEPAAAAAAAKRRDRKQLARIKGAYAAMEAADSLDAWTKADLEFHQSVLEATNNELMVSLFSVIETALATYFSLSASRVVDYKYSLPQHFAVLEAIRLQQAGKARDAMLGIVDDSRTNLSRMKR